MTRVSAFACYLLVLNPLLLFSHAAEAQAPDGLSELRQRSLELVNDVRGDRGLQPLQLSDRLNDIAQAHAEDMLDRNYYSHVSPGGEDVRDRLLKAGGSRATLVAENIARCENCPVRPDANSVRRFHRGWMESPEHRENILAQGLSDYGFGIAASAAGKVYAVQDFAGPGSPRSLEAGADAEEINPPAQTDLAAKLINEAREEADVAPLSADAGLVETAERIVPEPRPEMSLDDVGSLQSVVPSGASWTRLRMLAGSCGGCGMEPTDADVRFFVDEWKDDPRYRPALIDPQLGAIGMAVVANGGGRKIAVAILAGT